VASAVVDEELWRMGPNEGTMEANVTINRDRRKEESSTGIKSDRYTDPVHQVATSRECTRPVEATGREWRQEPIVREFVDEIADRESVHSERFQGTRRAPRRHTRAVDPINNQPNGGLLF
jgi:hypothetical protein